MTTKDSQRPLEGRIVLDLTTALSGPYATMLLGGLGARVIKIENPGLGGDSSRNNSPYVTESGLSLKRTSEQDMSVSMMLRGRNKESMTLNLKDPAGKQVFADLVQQADIVVENFSAGVTSRLGIDYEAMSTLNPKLVYTSISGFGAQGTAGTGKAMDTIIQALSGVMMTAGKPGEGPVRFGLPVADLVAPLYAVIGTLAAVLQTEQTGRGQHIDVSMLGALTSLVACEPFDAFERIGMPMRTGDYVPRLAPFGTFATSDGWFALCAPTNGFARGVMQAIGYPELADSPKFAVRDGRVAHADELHALVAAWAKNLTTEEAVAALELTGAPAAPVRSTADAVRDPLVLKRGEVIQLAHPVYGPQEDLYGSGLPIKMSGSDTSLDQPAPYLGEHTSSVLSDLLGYSADQVAGLRDAGIF